MLLFVKSYVICRDDTD